MGKSKDSDDNGALIMQVIMVFAGYLLSWWKGKSDKDDRA